MVIAMNMEDFKKLQCVQMEIMDEVHRVCCENGIAYYIIGGTALGAVRHGGFIPWDMDIDIAMPRADYERFAEVCKTALSSRYIYRDYKNTPKFMHPHALVCVRNTSLFTKFDRLNPKEEDLGIFLDIFPLDVAPKDEKNRQEHIRTIDRVKRRKYLRRGYLYRPGFIQWIYKKTMATLMCFYSIDKLNADFDKVCRRYEGTDSGLWCSMSSHYSYSKQCMPASVYGTPQLVEFEGRQYYAPEQLDEYLTRIFKDYMTLPPEKERQANLGYFAEVVFDK